MAKRIKILTKRTVQEESPAVSAGLLIFRVWLGVVLFAKHGLEKLLHFSALQQHFPDPIHIGPTAGLVCALVADAICSVLIALGLFTRLAALVEVINLLVVFIFMHHFSFAEEHAEVVYLYLGGYLALLFCGAGRYSVDSVIWRKNSK